MDQSLQRYLNDHLAGASGALLLIKEIEENLERLEAKRFFLALKQQVEADRQLLTRLEELIDKEPSDLLQAAGRFAARLGGLKFSWEGTEPGGLGMFEALETLALGVQGKLLLWDVLEEIKPSFPEWSGQDFSALKREAISQRDGVEFWRMETARECLISAERRGSTA